MIKFSILFISLLAINSSFALNKKEDCKCRVLISKKIVGGRQSESIYPWNVAFFSKDFDHVPDTDMTNDYKIKKFACSGTIINEKTILTSGLCSYTKSHPDQPYISASWGSNDLIELFGKQHEIAESITHPNFTFSPNLNGSPVLVPVNDLTIIKLKEPIKFEKNVGPACFDVENTVRKYTGNLITTGHGHTKAVVLNASENPLVNLPANRFLKEINVVDVSEEEKVKCWYDGLICTKGQTQNDSVCGNDIGSALLETKNGKSSVIGVTSFPSFEILNKEIVKGCLGDRPSFFVRTSRFWNWIKTHVGENYCN